MYQLTAADFADTGQWRLLLRINPGGMEASLQNTLHKEIPLQSLCSVSWEPDRERLCKNIEEAVYNNPRLLDDFATTIVVNDIRTLFLPREIAEASAGAEEEQYLKVYDAVPSDVMTATDGDITAVWCPGPGVKSFLMRTFPGARITCNLLEKVKECRAEGAGKVDVAFEAGKSRNEIRLFKEVRPSEVDLILMRGKELLSASTHNWQKPGDIEFLEKELKEVYENYQR